MDIVPKNTGDSLTAVEFNQIVTELETVITQSGQTPNAAILDQLARAIAGLVSTIEFYDDTGAVDAYNLTPLGGRAGLPALVDGALVRFRPDASNTGVATANVNSLGVRDINKYDDGTNTLVPVAADDILIDKDTILIYNQASDVWVLFQSGSGGGGLINPQKQVFTKGVEFNTGDTVLTLAQAPASINGTFVFQDASFTEEYTLGGVTLTLDNPITDDIQEIVVYALASLPIGVPGDATVTLAKHAPGTPDSLLGFDGSGDPEYVLKSSLTGQLMLIQDQKPAGTTGGTAANGVNIRDLNTVVVNEIAGASLGVNQFTLPAGKYRIRATAPITEGEESKVNINDLTNAVLHIGKFQYSSQPLIQQEGENFIQITLVAPATFQIEHNIRIGIATRGLGGGFQIIGGVEIYTQVEILKVQ